MEEALAGSERLPVRPPVAAVCDRKAAAVQENRNIPTSTVFGPRQSLCI